MLAGTYSVTAHTTRIWIGHEIPTRTNLTAAGL